MHELFLTSIAPPSTALPLTAALSTMLPPTVLSPLAPSWSLPLLPTMSPCSLLPLLPVMQPLQFQVLTYCDDFVEYSLYHDENEMNRLIEPTGMNITDRRIEGNHKMEETNGGSTDRDETKTDSSKSKASQRANQEERSKNSRSIRGFTSTNMTATRRTGRGQADKLTSARPRTASFLKAQPRMTTLTCLPTAVQANGKRWDSPQSHEERQGKRQ
jgi:hypothetical protein